MMLVMVRVALHRRAVGSTVVVIVRGAPYLTLLRSSCRPVILLGVALRLASPFLPPLLLLMGWDPCALVGEVAVTSPSAHVVVSVVAASLGAGRRGGLVRGPRRRAGLLDRSQSTFSQAMWRRVTPTANRKKTQMVALKPLLTLQTDI